MRPRRRLYIPENVDNTDGSAKVILRQGWSGESERIGSLASGKQADFVVIRGDPSSNIADIEKVEIVFKDAVGYDSAKLVESVRGSVGLH